MNYEEAVSALEAFVSYGCVITMLPRPGGGIRFTAIMEDGSDFPKAPGVNTVSGGGDTMVEAIDQFAAILSQHV